MLSRYAQPDAYTLEELRRGYYSLEPRGRVRLLRRLSQKDDLPEEAIQLAVEDTNAEVRQWIARHTHLSREQIEQFKRDPDEFVRACLWENPVMATQLFLPSERDWLAWFRDATHIERLAMMRNPCLDDRFIEIVLDPEDKELGVHTETRRELVLAFLSNGRRLRNEEMTLDEWQERTGGDASDYVSIMKKDKEHFERLWVLASKWPPESGVPYGIYQHVGADRLTKVRVYKQCRDAALRMAILENDTPELDEWGHQAWGPSELLELGHKDPDEHCRAVASRRSPPQPEPERKSETALSVGWHTLINVLVIALAVAIFASASRQFETVIFAILILLYTVVTAEFSAQRIVRGERALIDAQRFVRLLELLKDLQYRDAAKESTEAEHRQAALELKKARRILLVYEIGCIALTLLALYKLLTGLVL